jgi:hypothetical protein
MPHMPPPQSKSELSTHYRNGCRVARFKQLLGLTFIGIGGLSVVLAAIIMFDAPKAPEPRNQTAFEAGRAAGIRARHLIGGPISFALVLWVMGTVSCLWGRRQMKTLDAELSAAAFLSQAEKRELQAAAKAKGGISVCL